MSELRCRSPNKKTKMSGSIDNVDNISLLDRDSDAEESKLHTASPSISKCITPRFVMVTLCAFCTGISYCDRVNISVAVVDMSKEYLWTAQQKASVLGSFFYGYLLSQIIGALLAKRYGGKIVLGAAVFFWSMLTCLVPFCADISTHVLLVNRVALGFAEGFTFPVIYHFLSFWVTEEERSRSVAALSTGVFTGATLGFVISPVIMYHLGWRYIFYISGSLGFVWLLFWHSFAIDGDSYKAVKAQIGYSNISTQHSETMMHSLKKTHRDSSDSDGDDDDNGTTIEMTSTAGSTPAAASLESGLPLKVPQPGKFLTSSDICLSIYSAVVHVYKILSIPVCRAICFCHFCHNCGHYVLINWIPTYFDEELGIHGSSLAFACIPYAIMGLAVNLASQVADHFIKNKTDIRKVRRMATILGFVVAGVFMALLAVTPAHHSALSIAFLCISLSANASGPVAGYEAAKFDIVAPEHSGRLQGVSNTVATLSGVIGVPLVAYIKSKTNWAAVFYSIALIFASAALVFYRYGRWSARLQIV